jgi:alpha-galactosidase
VQLRVDWNHLPFLKGTYRIRDLWQKKDLGQTSTEFQAPVASHDVVLLRLSPLK